MAAVGARALRLVAAASKRSKEWAFCSLPILCNGRLAPFAKHHGSLVSQSNFTKWWSFLFDLCWQWTTTFFGWYLPLMSTLNELKGLLEYKSCVETRNYDRYCFRFYEIRVKSRRSNVKIWLQFTVYKTRLYFLLLYKVSICPKFIYDM